MGAPVGAVALGGQHVDLLAVEGLEQRRVIPEENDLRLDAVFLEERAQHGGHRAVQHADPPAVQRGGVGGQRLVRVVGDQVEALVAHGRVRIADQRLPVLPPGQPGQEVDPAVQQHLVQVAEFAVHILIPPAGVLRQLLVVFVGIACLDGALPGPLLEHLVFIVPDADQPVLGIRRESARSRQPLGQQERAEQQLQRCVDLPELHTSMPCPSEWSSPRCGPRC